MASSLTLTAEVNAKDLARVQKRLDKWQGAPLKVRTQKVQQGAMKLFIAPLRAEAARHNDTGATQKGYGVRKLRQKNYTELGAYKVSSNTWYKHFAIVGTKRGIQRDPYVDRVREKYHARIVAFIRQQIFRLA
jgi:hypothetical protein